MGSWVPGGSRQASSRQTTYTPDVTRRDDIIPQRKSTVDENIPSRKSAVDEIIPQRKSTAKRSRNTSTNSVRVGDVEFGDLEDLEIGGLSCPEKSIRNPVKVTPITQEVATQLRTMTVGDTQKLLGPEWTRQPFTFTENMNTPYGLYQKQVR